MQFVWQFIVSGVFFLAAIATIYAVIRQEHAGIRKLFGKFKAWRRRWTYNAMRLDHVEGQIVKLREELADIKASEQKSHEIVDMLDIATGHMDASVGKLEQYATESRVVVADLQGVI